MKNVAENKKEGKLIELHEESLKGHISEVVRNSVEETLNTLLDMEADQQVGAKKYERTKERRSTRAGHYNRKLHTKAGEVELKVPKLRHLKFETEIIDRYRRKES